LLIKRKSKIPLRIEISDRHFGAYFFE